MSGNGNFHRMDKGGVFPAADRDSDEQPSLERLLRYQPGALTTRDHLRIAGIVAAYGYLLTGGTTREAVASIRELRRKERAR